MKRLLYISLFLGVLISCKSDDMNYVDQDVVSGITGRWYLAETERSTINNSSFWEKVSSANSDTLTFRGDGVILDPDGNPYCCPPKSLTINGRLMDIKPQTALPPNPLCASVNCVYCPVWELTLNGNELIVSSCNNPRLKYVR